jgi:hypothetical protein
VVLPPGDKMAQVVYISAFFYHLPETGKNYFGRECDHQPEGGKIYRFSPLRAYLGNLDKLIRLESSTL